MPRSQGVSVENSFIKGFLTENSGLNFPENSCKDILNCLLTEYGEVKRRTNVDFENNFTLNSLPVSQTDSVVGYLWTGVGLQGDVTFVVYQVGSKIYFWNSSTTSAISNSKKTFSVDLETIKVPGAPPVATQSCTFSSGNGKLFVAHAYCQPFYITWDQISDAISTTQLSIKIRDFVVQEDGFAIDEEPTILTDLHRYNLYNQGWSDALITQWKNAYNSTYPSKAQVPWFFRNGAANWYYFEPINRAKNPITGNSLAPRGAKILDAFYQDRGISAIPIISSGYQRPTSVVFMNSRIFLSGVKSSGFGSTIYFSNILRATGNDITFYQKNDPTSEQANDLLSNDGGVIIIPDADSIVSMAQVKSYLLVFCTNGVWAIGGSQGVGFSATDFMVQKISDTPILSPQSLVVVEDTPIWWSHDGIYASQVNLEKMNVSSLTKETIQTFFNSIPNQCKQQVRTVYNRLTSEITWLYSSDVNNPKKFDSALVFRVISKSFYKHKFTANSYNIIGATLVYNHTSPKQTYPVVSNSGSTVTSLAGFSLLGESTTTDEFQAVYELFLVSNGSNLTFAVYKNTSFIDWESNGNSTPFDSYLITAYRVRGDALRKFQVDYLYVYSRQVPNSSCFMKGIWDYAIDERANDYSVEQQVIRPNSYRDVNARPLRVRGSGLTLQLEFRSESDKPFHLIGWSALESVNAQP